MDIENLKRLLEEKDKTLEIAAHYGKKLLEDNRQLSERLEKQNKEHVKKIEELEQQKHSLQMAMELKNRMENSHVVEIESLKENLETLHNLNKELNERDTEQRRKLSDLNKQINYLEEIQEKILQNETKWKEKVLLLEEQLRTLQEQLHHSNVNDDSYSDETSNLRAEFQQMIIDKQILENTITDLNHELETFQSQERKIVENYNKIQEELSNKDTEIKNYKENIEECKDEICMLKAEIENLKFGQTDPNRRGNSLFVEVDDKRKQVEKELVSLRVKYQASKESLQFARQQMNKMKYQMSTLWNMASVKADAVYIEKLEQSLFQSKQEIQELNQQLQKRRELESNNNIVNDKLQAPDYLKAMYQQSQKEVNSLNKQVQQLLFLKAAETDKLIQCQQNLYQEKKKSSQLRSEVLQLKLKIDELKQSEHETIKPKSITEKLSEFKTEEKEFTDKENIHKKFHSDESENQELSKSNIVEKNKQSFPKNLNEGILKENQQKATAPCISISSDSINSCPQQ
ncbi:protein Spindly-B-like [Centruroides sculpturatus]|uniref:protein Spindly-B-like n=1 Tax=Centruroides sculpturatus TaxID=218467 RepID=UPI000C6E6F10|nr:protein Spindly-B-like [Centruroides sculpturatus]